MKSHHWSIETHQLSSTHLHPSVSTTWRLYACRDVEDLFSKLQNRHKDEQYILSKLMINNIMRCRQPMDLWWIRSPWMTTKAPAFTSIETKSFWSYDGEGLSKWTPVSSLMNLLTRPAETKKQDNFGYFEQCNGELSKTRFYLYESQEWPRGNHLWLLHPLERATARCKSVVWCIETNCPDVALLHHQFQVAGSTQFM